MILVYNVTTSFVRLSRKARFEALFEYEQNDAFLIISTDAFLAIGNVKSWKSNLVKDIMIAAAVFTGLTQKPMLRNAVPETIVSEITVFMTETSVTQIDLNLEHIMFNGIIIYDISEVTTQITSVIDEFSEIWKDQDVTVNISKEEWMFIFFKSDAAFKPSRVYLVNQKDKNVIDETFNKLHDQGKMQWIN